MTEWKSPIPTIGLATIDEQHAELVRHFVLLSNECISNSNNLVSCMLLIAEFRKEFEAHIKTEEAILELYNGWEGIRDHLAEHQELLRHVQQLYQAVSKSDCALIEGELDKLTYLIDRHMTVMDLQTFGEIARRANDRGSAI